MSMLKISLWSPTPLGRLYSNFFSQFIYVHLYDHFSFICATMLLIHGFIINLGLILDFQFSPRNFQKLED